MNMLTVYISIRFWSYGIVGTILLVLSSVAPVHLMMDMSQESGNVVIGLYCLSLQWFAVHGIFDLALFWIQSGFIFLLVMCSVPLEHRTLVSDMTD